MPECVRSWAVNGDPEEVSAIQAKIISSYELDFSRHNGNVNGSKILQVFRHMVPQLAKGKNEKFMYSAISKSARARDFEDAIEWLADSGIAHRIFNVSKNCYPLKAYEMLDYFKLFLLDVGLTRHMAKIPNASIMLSEEYQFKGQLTESYVLEQLAPLFGGSLNFHAYSQDREIDFIVQNGEQIVPIEVKSSDDKQAVSFKSYIGKYKPETAVRFNANGYLKNGAITNIPLYFVGKFFELTSVTG